MGLERAVEVYVGLMVGGYTRNYRGTVLDITGAMGVVDTAGIEVIRDLCSSISCVENVNVDVNVIRASLSTPSPRIWIRSFLKVQGPILPFQRVGWTSQKVQGPPPPFSQRVGWTF